MDEVSGRAHLSFSDSKDVEEFAQVLGQFERGEIGASAWRAFRLLRGTYGQRQDDASHMLRTKLPQGVISAAQLRVLADIGERYSRGFGHITTRQNIQFHFINLGDFPAALSALAEVGITTREACGNSVRNITCCPFAGVAADEAFDVTPYAEAMTRHFLRHPLSASLPRKFKIAFEGCREDHAGLAIHDLGFWAKAGERFSVTVGGGTSILCRAGQPLVENLAVAEILNVAEAVVRIFHRFGDHQHRNRNRLKFLIKQLGWDGFRDKFAQALDEVREQGGIALPFTEPSREEAPSWSRPALPSREAFAAAVDNGALKGPGLLPVIRTERAPQGFDRFCATNVIAQKQTDYVTVTLSVPLGDVTSAQWRGLAALSESVADGSVRISSEQNVVLRWVARSQLETVYQYVSALGLGLAEANTIADVTSCPGAETCKLAVTQSRGLGRVLEDHVRQNPRLIAAAPDLRMKVSGCPNGCGRHHIAGIGFQGSIRKIDGRAVPQYFVLVGGGAQPEGTRFGKLAAKIVARRVPQAIDALVDLYLAERHEGELATAFFARVDLARAQAVLAPLEALTAADASPEDFIDLGEHSAFVPATSEGECAS